MKNLIRAEILLVVVLMILGSLLVLSASGTYSAEKFDNLYFLFKSHISKIIIAIALLVITAMIPYDLYRKYSKHILVGTILLLAATLIFAPKIKGAARWIDLWIIQFQPSELAKIVLLMHLAVMIEKKGDLIRDFKNGFVFTLVWVFIVAGLILMQPNVSTTLLVIILSFTILYVGGAKFKHVLATSTVVGGIGVMFMMLFTHSRERVLSFINGVGSAGDINIQVKQAKIALGSGGFFGVGLGNSQQSNLFLPESYGDFIFSVLGEELGFLGALLVLFIYFSVFFIGVLIAKKAKDPFGQLLAYGLSFNIILSAFINAAVVTGMVPTTGITLPFISFGGTSIIVFCISIGLIISIGRYSQVQQQELIPVEA